MRTQAVWSDTVPERDGVKSICYDIAFRPDGTQLIAAVGTRVLVYDAAEGDLLHSLKGHKDAVYCVTYSRDGKRFASGGADKTVIIWTHTAEGMLKYTHNDAIQCLAYNPLTQQLASATATDFGLWSPEQKSVAKHKLPAKALCCSWTSDGQYLAIGLFNGAISIRETKGGTEQVLIQRNAPVWTLSWNPSREEHDTLAVGCWDGTLSLYRLNGTQVGKDKEWGCDPLSVSHFSNGEYLAVGGSDRKVVLVTREGTRLVDIAEREDWVWCVQQRPKQNFVAVGCNDGSITMYQLVFSTVHGLYQDRYAFRDNMTDVVVQHLITEQKVRIKCKDYVKKISVYKERLAVQLPDKVVLYELAGKDDPFDMQYRVATKLNKKLECNLLVVTSMHVILCLEKKLQLYNLEGEKEREWVLDSVIRYIKVVGGPSGREGLLVGLKSGLILEVLLDNPFPIHLVKHTASIRCLDLSAEHTKLAIVDENTSVVVYDVRTKEAVFEEKNANSVAWNSEMDSMLCFSGNGMLSIKTGEFPVHRQKLQGFVVGFKGSKIFCLHYVSMQTIDAPQGASMYRYLERRDFSNAYRVACLGVTDSDWRALALEALTNVQLDVAQKAFIRVRDVRYLDLINRYLQSQRANTADEQAFLAEVLAYQRKYVEAGQAFARCGKLEKAMEMFTDLRMFDEAKAWAEELAKTKGDSGAQASQVVELIQKQAEWSEEVNDHVAAADMYLKAGKLDKAIAIMGRNGWTDRLLEVARSVPKTETKALLMCASFFRQSGHVPYAKETYLKMGDYKALMQLHVDLSQWEDALALLKQHPEFTAEVLPCHAKWLLMNDRFEEARVTFKRAGQPDQARKMLQELAANAVTERRFRDAAQLLHLQAMDHLEQVGCTPFSRLSASQRASLSRFWHLRGLSEVYYAYSFVHRTSEQPFRSVLPETLFNMARFLFLRLYATPGLAPPASLPWWSVDKSGGGAVAKETGGGNDSLRGISRAFVLQALAKQAEALGSWKVARAAWDKLQSLRLPSSWQDQADLAALAVRSRPFSDSEDLLPLCYRCSQPNALITTHGDACSACGQPFVRSFATFESLPLVEFEVEEGISHEDAMQLLDQPGPSGGPEGGSGLRGRELAQNSGAQTLRLDEEPDDDDTDGSGGSNPFSSQMLAGGAGVLPQQPVRADHNLLLRLQRSRVVVLRWPARAIRPRYFYVIDPDAETSVCGSCNHVFESEEWDAAQMESKNCPFCRGDGELLQPYVSMGLEAEYEEETGQDTGANGARRSSGASSSSGASNGTLRGDAASPRPTTSSAQPLRSATASRPGTSSQRRNLGGAAAGARPAGRPAPISAPRQAQVSLASASNNGARVSANGDGPRQSTTGPTRGAPSYLPLDSNGRQGPGLGRVPSSAARQ